MMTITEKQSAHAAIVERYELNQAQDDKLQEVFSYSIILMFAHHEAWEHAQHLLCAENVYPN